MNNCPKCNYNLRGLPEFHVCPECGLEYDPACIVLKFPAPRGVLTQVVLGVGLLVMFVGVGGRAGFRAEDVWLIAIIVGSMTMAVTPWSRGADRSCVVIASLHGLELEHPRLNTSRIPWDAMASARYSWLFGQFTIKSSEGKVLIRCPSAWLGGPRSARHVAGWIQARRAHYVAGLHSGKAADGGQDGVSCR